MNEQLAEEIQRAQCHGRQKYGRGPDDIIHDLQQPDDNWHDYIADHNERARLGTPMERREHLVKVAGLACSAIEAFDVIRSNESSAGTAPEGEASYLPRP